VLLPDHDHGQVLHAGAGTCTTRRRCSSAPDSSSVLAIPLINVADPRLPAGRQPLFSRQNTTSRAGIASLAAQGQAAQRLTHRGKDARFPWPQLRRAVLSRPLTRSERQARQEPILVYVRLNTAGTDDRLMAGDC